MSRFLILRLDGPMQAWGTHTFEDFRPSSLFPTRSGLLGLFAACLGIERRDEAAQDGLAQSLSFAVRIDHAAGRPELEVEVARRPIRLVDFHTVRNARLVDGSPSEHPVVSRREYLFDAAFTVAVSSRESAAYSLETLAHALANPCYTPVLGRRSCPLGRPLFEGWREAADTKTALDDVPPSGGLIYAEGEPLADGRPLQIRDVPMRGRHRRFATRWIFLHAGRDT